MFRTVPLSIIRNFSLYTQQWHVSYRFADSLRAVSKLIWHVPLLCVQRKTPDNGQRNCPKHVEFYCTNKFEKLVHLVGFIIRIKILSIKGVFRAIWKICWVHAILQNSCKWSSPPVSKVCSAYAKGSATSSQGIRAYIYVMVDLKFNYF